VHSLPPSLLLPLPVSLLYTHSLPPYCCPYPCPYCTLTPSLPRRSDAQKGYLRVRPFFAGRQVGAPPTYLPHHALCRCPRLFGEV